MRRLKDRVPLTALVIGILASIAAFTKVAAAAEKSDFMDIRRYYQTNDLVNFFDAAVFNGIEDAVLIKPGEVVVTPVLQTAREFPYQLEFSRDYNIELCMVGRGCGQDSPVVYFEARGANRLTFFGMPLEEWIMLNISEREQFRPSVNAYMELVEKGARLVESAQGRQVTRTCVSVAIGHDLNWTPKLTSSAPRVLVLSNHVYSSWFDRPSTSRCLLSSLLQATGVRASVTDLFVEVEQVAQFGPEVDCILKLLADDSLIDGMSRNEALQVIEEIQASGASCRRLN